MYESKIKNGMVFLITILFLMTIIGHTTAMETSLSYSSHTMEKNKEDQRGSPTYLSTLTEESTNSTEVVDQNNLGNSACGGDTCIGLFPLGTDITIAQSFIPSQNSLTKVSIKLFTTGVPPDNIEMTLSIRESLSGDDLTSASTFAAEGYITFDFPDITVNPGETYYMVGRSENLSSSSDGYSWFYTKKDRYDRGTSYIAESSDSFIQNEDEDMYFNTYWRDYAPTAPEVIGPSNGKAQKRYNYEFSATDPEQNDVYFFIDWGDGRTWDWIGPYESGTTISKTHQWARQGEYTIRVKAKDSYGVESDWSEPFAISMPKSKEPLNLFLNFLENHPHLFPILQLLLQR